MERHVVTTLFRTGGQANTVLLPDGIVRITKIEIFGVVADGSLIPLATIRAAKAYLLGRLIADGARR